MSRESVLLASSTEKGEAMLRQLVPEGRFEQIKVCRTGGEVRRAMVDGAFSLFILNAPLTDENGLELAREAASSTTAGVILLVKADVIDMVAARMEECGVLVISRPVVRQLFDQALRFSLAARHRLIRLQSENERLEKKLAEQRLIDRAKCVLMQYLSMSEEQAHRYLEKQAMDQRQPRVTIARAVIATYEL